MMQALPARLRRFAHDTRATVVIEFAVMLPLYLTIFLSGVELGMMTIRQTQLERAMDQLVREIRLGIGLEVEHDVLRDRLCEYAGILPNCRVQMKLDMEVADFRSASTDVDPGFQCIDRAATGTPLVTFKTPENAMMILRACYKFQPIFPTVGLGTKGADDAYGDLRLVAISAFVTEPE